MAKGTLNVGGGNIAVDSAGRMIVDGGQTITGTQKMVEQADADADTAAQGQIWVNTATPNELYFTTDAGDDIQLTTSTRLAATPADGAQTFNDTGAAVDFRIESDDNANMFFLDGSEDKIGIGTSAPAAALDVVGEVVMRKNAIRNPRFQSWIMGG